MNQLHGERQEWKTSLHFSETQTQTRHEANALYTMAHNFVWVQSQHDIKFDCEKCEKYLRTKAYTAVFKMLKSYALFHHCFFLQFVHSFFTQYCWRSVLDRDTLTLHRTNSPTVRSTQSRRPLRQSLTHIQTVRQHNASNVVIIWFPPSWVKAFLF